MLLAVPPIQSSDRITSSFVRNIRKGMLKSNLPAGKTNTLLTVLRLIQDSHYEDALDLAYSNGMDLERMHRDYRAAMADRHRKVATALFCTRYGLGVGWLREHRYEGV